MGKELFPKSLESFFRDMVDLIKENLNPDFILVAGSFGKESWLYANKKLISDIEIIFVCKNNWSVPKKNQFVKKINKKYPYDIELKGFVRSKIEKGIISNYASKNPGYINLNFFDGFSNPVYLYRKNKESLNVKPDINEVPAWEAWRLYVNRMADILKLDETVNINLQSANYYWLKIFESTADAYCIINNLYKKNIAKRVTLFNKRLIESDNELSDSCKFSFPIIQNALQARKNHDLSLFKINIPVSDRMQIINSWMTYFEMKMGKQEEIRSANRSDFYDKYIKNKQLQSKYLDFNSGMNIILTNSIKWLTNRNKLKYPFKFYVQNYSWRHIILLSVSSAFFEKSRSSMDFSETKKITKKLISVKETEKLNNVEYVQTILKYWRVIR